MNDISKIDLVSLPDVARDTTGKLAVFVTRDYKQPGLIFHTDLVAIVAELVRGPMAKTVIQELAAQPTPEGLVELLMAGRAHNDRTLSRAVAQSRAFLDAMDRPLTGIMTFPIRTPWHMGSRFEA